jgi:NADH-quinone oxidoreductase subunit L
MPITFWTMLIFTLAISGIPFTSGFLSKDEILAGTLAFSKFSGHVIIPIVGFLVAGMTAFYMFRMMIVVFFGEHPDKQRAEHIHESPKQMTIPLIVLAVLSFFAFYSFNPFSASSGWFYESVTTPVVAVPETVAATPTDEFIEEVHHQHTLAMILSVSIAGLGILIAFATYYWRKISADAIANRLKPVHTFLSNKWYFDELYDATAVAATIGVARILAWFDAKIIDGIVNGAATVTRFSAVVSGKFDNIVVDGLVNFTAYFAGFTGMLLRTIQTGKLQTYLIFVLIGVLALIALYI